MRNGLKAMALPALLFSMLGCAQSDDAKDDMEAKQTYSLCPTTEDSRRRLHDQVKSFADQQGARFIDRSAGAQQELSDIGSDVLNKTGGSPMLLTVEKSDEFRVSITNLGLRDKIALTIRSQGGAGEGTPVANFMADLSRSWAIEEVQGGVTNDPPC